MKAKEVLQILNITRPTLCKYVKEGKIKVDAPNAEKRRKSKRESFELIIL